MSDTPNANADRSQDTSDPGAVLRLEPPSAVGDFEQAAGRADRDGGVRRERENMDEAQHLITEALAYTEASGMPVRIEFAGVGTTYVECDRRTIRIQPDDAFWRFESKYFAAPDTLHGEVLGVFDTFAAAAEAPLPVITDRTLRVTLHVLVIAAPELGDVDGDLDKPNPDIGAGGEETLHDLQPEDIADVFNIHSGMETGDTYGAHPWDELLAGTGLFIRFGQVRVHDAQWEGYPSFQND